MEKAAAKTSGEDVALGVNSKVDETTVVPEKKPNADEFDDPICCCLCGSAVDHADRTAFFEHDRQQKLKELESAPYDSDEYHWKQPSKLLPTELYNPNNTLLFCDTCDRPYHQHCHFVPVLTIPKGDWHCLPCQSVKDMAGKKVILGGTSSDPSEKPLGKWSKALLQDELWACKPPPAEQFATLQAAWEFQSKALKLAEWKRQIQRLRASLKQPLQQIRLTQTAILTYTSTRRARQNFTLRSQELRQTFFRLTSNKKKVRDWILNLETILKHGSGEDRTYRRLLEFCRENSEEEEVWFPFGMNYPRRHTPRLIPPEALVAADSSSEKAALARIPKEVQLNGATHNTVSKRQSADHSAPPGDDEDDLISLEDLKCCICFRGEATDENDVLMCDGAGCFRSHHMHCLPKPLTQQEAQKEEDWFCPLCTFLARIVSEIQSEYTGDEWVDGDDGGSIDSWENAQDVFPESVKEHEHATKWKEDRADDETQEFLLGLFGLAKNSSAEEQEDEEDDLAMDEDDEDDDDFDLAKHVDDDDEKAEREADDKEASRHASTKVSKEELEALSCVSSSEDEDEGESGPEAPKRKRRRRAAAVASAANSRATSRTNTSGEEDASEVSRSGDDVGRLDESNIILGKRRRAKVDYNALNDRMFGNLNATASKKIDDEDEFRFRGFRNDSSDSSNDESSDDDDDDEEGSGEQSETKQEAGRGKAKGGATRAQSRTSVKKNGLNSKKP